MRGAGPSSPGSSAALWKVALLGGRWRIHQSSIFLAVSKPPATTVGLLMRKTPRHLTFKIYQQSLKKKSNVNYTGFLIPSTVAISIITNRMKSESVEENINHAFACIKYNSKESRLHAPRWW